MTRLPRRAALGALALPLARPAAAQGEWPTQPVRLLIPFAPGGVPDIVARLIAPPMQGALGRPVLVENRPGAAGALAAETVARSAPDGHTLFVTTMATHAVGPALHGAALRYDAERDFAPIALLARVPLVLLVNPALDVRDVAGLVALLRREPGRHAFGSSGVGAVLHLAGELLKQQAGVEATHVPYRGSVPALTDLAAGRITYFFDALPPALPFIRDGRVRALGVGSRTRAAAAPELPPLAEAGLPGFEAVTWAALYAPAGVPTPILARIHAETLRALRAPEVASRLAELAYEVVGSTPAELVTVQREERERWAAVIGRAGIRPET
ncbi:MAG TPA: tripartite tricarboxylate transporter substrate binding protein [Acetobacteraceae bacterium]|nr:tripartite tricarboxylate transporter substrate binding protein [Acetobacteraceae bacterium]